MGVESETEESEMANVIVRLVENIAIFVSCIILISWTILGLDHPISHPPGAFLFQKTLILVFF